MEGDPGSPCVTVTAAESWGWDNSEPQHSHPYSKQYWKLKVTELIVRLKKTAISLLGRKAKLPVVGVEGGGKKSIIDLNIKLADTQSTI